MEINEINERIDQFDQRLRDELKPVENGTFYAIASDYEAIDCDPPPIVF